MDERDHSEEVEGTCQDRAFSPSKIQRDGNLHVPSTRECVMGQAEAGPPVFRGHVASRKS